MNSERKDRDAADEEIGAIDPRRGPIPETPPEDVANQDTRDLEADRKQNDEPAVQDKNSG